MADVGGGQVVGRAGGAGDVGAGEPSSVAALPLVRRRRSGRCRSSCRSVALSVEPSSSVPLTTGTAVLTGGAAWAGAVWAEPLCDAAADVGGGHGDLDDVVDVARHQRVGVVGRRRGCRRSSSRRRRSAATGSRSRSAACPTTCRGRRSACGRRAACRRCDGGVTLVGASGEHLGGGRRGRAVAAGAVGGGDDDAHRAADVAGDEVVGRAGRARQVGAVGAVGVAALPLVRRSRAGRCRRRSRGRRSASGRRRSCRRCSARRADRRRGGRRRRSAWSWRRRRRRRWCR